MLEYSMHNHTYRCKHARGSEEDMVLQAIDNKIKYFGVSDHVAYDTKASNYRMEYSEADEYLSIMHKLKEKYKNKINIFVGFEAEYQNDLEYQLISYFNDYNLDYLVLGQHYGNIHDVTSYYGQYNNDEYVKAYVDQCIDAMASGLFLFLAHPDLFMNSINEFTLECQIQSKRLIEASIKYNVLLEYNAGGVRNSEHRAAPAYPRPEFWKLVKSYKIPIIVNSDAHSPQQIEDWAYEKALKQANELGLVILDKIDIKSYQDKVKTRLKEFL